jgi:receptor protein-tyrosine kinase
MMPPTTVTKLFPATPRRSIGAILIDQGRITVAQADLILRKQKQDNIRFGEAAIQLGLLSKEDIRHALSHQYGYASLRPGQSRISTEIVAAYQPQGSQVEALRALRSQLMLRWFGGNPRGSKALAVVSPGRGEGRSYLAANLAVACAQLGESTLLIDADMRDGRQHELFHLENHSGLSSVLSGRSPTAPVLRLADIESLSILTAGPVPPNPQELLGREVFGRLMDRFTKMFDVIVIDTPAGTDYADAQTLSARAGGALMLARQNVTSLSAAAQFGTTLTELGVSLVGAVLSDF